MMKKLLIVSLAVSLLLGLACAQAETIETVELTLPLTQPDSPVLITLTCNGALEIEFDADAPATVVRVTIHSEEHADVVICIAPSELYAGRSMADLSEEELDELRALAGAQYEDPVFATETSPEGNLYLFVSSNEESDVDSLFTIYQGYFVELIQHHDDYSEQTEADDDFARSLLYGIEFAANETAAE